MGSRHPRMIIKKQNIIKFMTLNKKSQRIQIFFPFQRQKIFFPVVALFTASNDISLRGPPPPTQGDDMIHRQLFPTNLPAAVIAHPRLYTSIPPMCSSQRPRFVFFSLYIRFVHRHRLSRFSRSLIFFLTDSISG